MTKLKSFLVGMLAMASYAHADSIYIGQPNFGGNGCPAGTASATLSPDAKSLSILFDQYIVEANGSKPLDRKSCNIAVPVHVPQGFSVSIFQVDYRGYNGLPAGASSQLDVEYFFAGGRGPRVSRAFFGNVDDNYLVSNKLAATALVWSACGVDTNLRINSSMRVRTNGAGEEAMSTVDSVDLKASLIYLIQWRRC